jgi:hypothetical protein
MVVPDLRVDGRRGAGHERVLAARDDRIHDRDDLGGGLARTEHRLGRATPQRAVMIHLGEAQVFEGRVLSRSWAARGESVPRFTWSSNRRKLFGSIDGWKDGSATIEVAVPARPVPLTREESQRPRFLDVSRCSLARRDHVKGGAKVHGTRGEGGVAPAPS